VFVCKLGKPIVTDDESICIGYLFSTLIVNTSYEIYDFRVMVLQGKVLTNVQGKVGEKVELFTGVSIEIKICLNMFAQLRL
jgi:hypothetical protein